MIGVAREAFDPGELPVTVRVSDTLLRLPLRGRI
jgi:hypothetical protein